MNIIQEGLVCNQCARLNGLLWADDYESEGPMGSCMTCGKRAPVLDTSDYVIPTNVTLIKSKVVASMVQELKTTKKMFDKLSELYKTACDEIERLESENRMLKLGSKWGGSA